MIVALALVYINLLNCTLRIKMKKYINPAYLIKSVTAEVT